MSDDSKALVQRLYDGINANDPAVFDLVADGFVEHEELPPPLPQSAEGVKQMFAAMHAAFSGFRMNVEAVLAEGDRVAVRATMTGTHTGEFMGAPPTGNAVSVPLVDWFRIENGRVAEHWGVLDTGALMMQIGAA